MATKRNTQPSGCSNLTKAEVAASNKANRVAWIILIVLAIANLVALSYNASLDKEYEDLKSQEG